MHRYESSLQETIYARLSAVSKGAIDRLLTGDESDAGEDSPNTAEAASSFAKLKADLGKASRDNLLVGIERRQAIAAMGLPENVFEGIPVKFIEQFRQRCATIRRRSATAWWPCSAGVGVSS